MASASGFGTPTPPQWTGVQTLVQNWLRSKSPEFLAQQAQLAKENAFRQHSQELADKQFQDTHAAAGINQEQGQFNLNQAKRQFHLMTYDPQSALSGNDSAAPAAPAGPKGPPPEGDEENFPGGEPVLDQSVPSGHDVGQEQAPAPPAAGATAAPGEPTSFKNPQQPSSQATTTLPKSDSTETAVEPSADSGNGFDYNIYGFKVGTGHPGDVRASNPKTTFAKPLRQIPSLKGDQKASNSLPDVPSSSGPPQPDSASLGAAPRLNAVPSATTASSAAAGGDAGPSTDAMQFGIHSKSPSNAAANAADEGVHDASTPWEKLSPGEQKKIIAGYQKGAPAGTSISPTEAVRAYRMQQWARSGFSTPQGMYADEMSVDPNTGLPTIKYKANPFAGEGDESGGGMATPAGLEMAGKVDTLNKSISGDENMKSAQNVIKAYGNMLQQAELAKTSKAPGVNDRTLAQLYAQTFAPNAKFNEATQELIGDTHNIVDAIKQPLLHALSGQTLLPEHREAILESARLNAQAAHNAAIQSTMAPRSLGELALGKRRAMQLLTQVPELPGEATGTSPRVGNGTVEGSAGSGQNKTLDAATAQRFLDQAKGDNQKARALARSAGYAI